MFPTELQQAHIPKSNSAALQQCKMFKHQPLGAWAVRILCLSRRLLCSVFLQLTQDQSKTKVPPFLRRLYNAAYIIAQHKVVLYCEVGKKVKHYCEKCFKKDFKKL